MNDEMRKAIDEVRFDLTKSNEIIVKITDLFDENKVSTPEKMYIISMIHQVASQASVVATLSTLEDGCECGHCNDAD